MAKTKTKMAKPARIGILGGSFDPPHVGHLAIAQRALDQLRLDVVLFIPARRSPHKRNRTLASAVHRLAMTGLAVRGNKSFRVDAIEIRRQGVSYTVRTLRQIRERHPGAALFFLLGEDNLRQFRRWYRPLEIAALASLVIHPRSGNRKFRRPRNLPRLLWLKGPLVNVSSSEIRELVSRGESLRYLVPDSVGRYIRQHRLYRR